MTLGALQDLQQYSCPPLCAGSSTFFAPEASVMDGEGEKSKRDVYKNEDQGVTMASPRLVRPCTGPCRHRGALDKLAGQTHIHLNANWPAGWTSGCTKHEKSRPETLDNNDDSKIIEG